jgi:hypothetical protein
MTEITDAVVAEVLWASSEQGKAAVKAAWEKAGRLDHCTQRTPASPPWSGTSTDQVSLDIADVGAIVYAAISALQRVSRPDIQYFAEDGTWVKPAGAERVDVMLQAGGGGAAHVMGDGLQGGVHVRGGRDGEIKVQSISASQLPDLMSVMIGRGGRIGGRDGYALIVTHLEEGEQR